MGTNDERRMEAGFADRIHNRAGGVCPTPDPEGSERQSRPAAPGAASLVRIYVTLINVNTSAHFLFSFLYIQ